MCVLLLNLFNGCSLAKKQNRLISKGTSNIYYRKKVTFLKLVRKANFSERKFEEMY